MKTTNPRMTTTQAIPPTSAFVVCPAALVADAPTGVEAIYRQAYEMARESVSRRWWTREFEPSLN